MINNLPKNWDMEADVVCLGSGIGGLGAAITAYDHGASAIVLERAEQVGGVTALSLGECWVPGNELEAALGIEDSPESGFRYLKRLAMGYNDDLATLNLTVHAREALHYFTDKIGLKMMAIRGCPDYYYGHNNDAVAEGRLLEVEPFDAKTLGDWQERTRVSPVVPYGMTHPDMMAPGGSANMAKWDFALMGERLANDIRCLGAGLAATFVKGVIDRDIPMHTGMNAVELIGDGDEIVGVRCEKDGANVFVKALRGVVVAVSSYERNADYNKTLAQQLDLGTMVFATIDGANFRLTGPVGARIASVPDVTLLGARVPGEEMEDGSVLTRSVMAQIGLPHTIVVNRSGKRFGDESFYREFFMKTDIIDGATQTHPNFPCWAILDSQARGKYPFAAVMPGQDFPEGMAVKADTIAELAAGIGVDPQTLEATVARFNLHAAKAEDPDWGRGSRVWSSYMSGDKLNKPHPNFGTLTKPPYYAVELCRMGGSAIPSTGVVADQHCRADWLGRSADPRALCCGQFGRATGNRRGDAERRFQRARHGAWLSRRAACGGQSQHFAGAGSRAPWSMIETEQSVVIAAPIDQVWTYAKDVERWASIMPGYQSCELIDEDSSRWVLKVGVGGLVRTVKVSVHVDRWAGPEKVDFSFKLEGDPVSGGGAYRAAAKGANATDVTLHVRVNGGGPMAPMWEAMGGPLLPKFAAGFAEQLKAKIEAELGLAAAPRQGLWARFTSWLRRLWSLP